MMRTMNVTFACPGCERTSRVELGADQGAQVGQPGPARPASVEPGSRREVVRCDDCGLDLGSSAGASESGHLCQCLICGSHDLFVRKDFPQRLGVTIVVLGFAASCVTWYFYWTYLTFGILFATALIDLVLYKLMGDALICYRCGAQYRQVDGIEQHGAFNLETHERYRQQAARLSQRVASRGSVGE